MFKGYGPLLVLWMGGLAIAGVLASSKGQVDLTAERGRQLTQINQLTTSLRLAFDNFAERNASDLARIIEVEMTQDSISSWLVDSPFQAVALVDQEVNGTWKTEWARSKESASAKDTIQGWLSKLPLDKITGEFVSWNRVEVPGQRPSLILGVQLRLKTANSEKTQIALGVLPLDHLAVLTEPLKTEGSEIFLIDSAGYSLTFPNPQYVGSYMDVHPLVNAAVKAQTISDVGDFRNLAGEATIGGFERVKNSNVYVIANLPTTTPIVYASRQLSESGFVILGILILLSLPLWFIQRADNERLSQLRQTLLNVDSGQRENTVVIRDSGVKASPELVDVARKELFERFASVVFQQLKGPIYGAIGKASRLQTQIPPEQKEVLTALEAELRKSKMFVEGLGRTLKFHERGGTEVNLAKVFEADLARSAEQLQKQGVDVDFSPGANLVVKSHPDDAHKIFLTILKRTWETDMPATQNGRRKLIIRLESQGPIVRATFLFHGLKIGEGQAEKIFDIRGPDDLDLSVARGLAYSWNGLLTAEDSLAGLRFILELPVAPGFEVVKNGHKAAEISEAKSIPYKATPVAANLAPEITLTKSETLELKKVDETLNRVLPPAPKPERTGISVVEDLTATEEMANPKDVKIRKPRVRIDG